MGNRPSLNEVGSAARPGQSPVLKGRVETDALGPGRIRDPGLDDRVHSQSSCGSVILGVCPREEGAVLGEDDDGMSTLAATWMLILGALLEFSAGGDPIEVQVPIGAARDIDVAELVARLSDATGLTVARPSGELRLPIVGVAGGLTRTMLTESLGPDASLSIRPEALVVTLDPRLRQAESSAPVGKARQGPRRTRRGRGEKALELWDARPQVVSTERSRPADDPARAWPEFDVEGLQASDRDARRGRVRPGGLRLPVQPQVG